MVLFNSDYTEGAHPKIMELMMSSNMEQTGGYGMDAYCDKARALIRQQCGREDIDVQFLVGGTQTNLTVIAATLRPHQGAQALSISLSIQSRSEIPIVMVLISRHSSWIILMVSSIS